MNTKENELTTPFPHALTPFSLFACRRRKPQDLQVFKRESPPPSPNQNLLPPLFPGLERRWSDLMATNGFLMASGQEWEGDEGRRKESVFPRKVPPHDGDGDDAGD